MYSTIDSFHMTSKIEIHWRLIQFIFNAVRHLGAQVTIERPQFTVFLKLFMPVLGLVILLYSYHGMTSVPTVKKIKPNSFIFTYCERTVITKSFVSPIPSYSNLCTKMADNNNFNFNECHCSRDEKVYNYLVSWPVSATSLPLQ